MSLFHFLRPEWFLALLPLVILYWLLRRLHLQNKNWQNFCDESLLPHLFQSSPSQNKKRPLFLLAIAGCLAITALAGPTWEQRPQPVFKKQSALIIILDLSRSMDATDIKPSRITRALHKVEDILQRRQEGQTALIVFAGDAFTVTPLTEDTATISSQVKSLNTAIMPVQGSNTNKAIQLAHSLFKQSSQLSGHVLLITDGINPGTISTAELLSAENYSLSVLGVGSADGSPIPVNGGGFFKNHSGDIVIPKLDTTTLQKLALAGAGFFRLLSTDDSDIEHLLSPLDSDFDKNQSQATKLNTDTWFEAGPWLLLALLPIAAFAFRKGYLFIIVLFIIPRPDPVYAFELNQLWKNDNQRAHELFSNDDAKKAADTFSDEKWKAAAEYKSGQYQTALESYQKLDSTNPDNLYNLANTQAKLGQYDEALQNYNKLIEQNPEHADAKHNRDQIEKLQQDQQQQNNSDKNNDSKDKQDKDNTDNKQDSSQSDQSNDGNKESDSKQQNDGTDKESKPSDDKQNKADDSPEDDAKQEQASAEEKQAQAEKQDQTEKSKDDQLSKEQKQANQQWLRRIPDDPGGLLRRKFQYQSQQRQNRNSGDQQW